MDVNLSNCLHCKQRIHYTESKLLPEGGGVCLKCATEHGYRACEECQDYFIPRGEEDICEICLKRILTEF
jgi:hypothetical protein